MGYSLHAFEHSAALNIDKTRMLEVSIGHYCVVNRGSYIDRLTTRSTNVCAGWALIEQAPHATASIGMMHVFSDLRFYPHGQNAIRDHARRAWQTFTQNLPAHSQFNAFAFGGRKPRDTHDLAPLPQADVECYFETCAILGKLLRQEPANKHKRTELLNILHQPHINALTKPMAERVSWWIGDELYRCAHGHDGIDICGDYRFQGAPHDAMIVRDTQQVIIASSKDKIIPAKHTIWSTKKEGTALFQQKYGLSLT